MKSWARFGVLIFYVVLAVFFLTVTAYAGHTVTKKATAQEQAAAGDFWTKEKIKAAAPAKMPVDKGHPGVDAAVLAGSVEEISGPPTVVAGGMADPDADEVARAVYWQDWEALEKEQALEQALGEPLDTEADEQTGTSSIYTWWDYSSMTTLYNWNPHKRVGRLVFQDYYNRTYQCSAAVIKNNYIVTAGHCAYDTVSNRWHKNWVFVPAYRNGYAPYGTFRGTVATILTAYLNLSGSYSINTWARYDVAIIKLGYNSAGRSVNSMVGYLGYKYNFGYNNVWFNTGYPAKDYRNYSISYPGQYQRACINEGFQQASYVVGGGCKWGPGISGGPWLVTYQPNVSSTTSSNLIGSVNSGYYVGAANLYGGLFNTTNIYYLCSGRCL